VHFATADDLRAIFPPEGEQRLRIGRLAAAEEVPVSLDVGRLVIRHAAVVGSTGAGKTSSSNTAAAFCPRWVARGQYRCHRPARRVCERFGSRCSGQLRTCYR
jgi:hypothetical protein